MNAVGGPLTLTFEEFRPVVTLQLPGGRWLLDARTRVYNGATFVAADNSRFIRCGFDSAGTGGEQTPLMAQGEYELAFGRTIMNLTAPATVVFGCGAGRRYPDQTTGSDSRVSVQNATISAIQVAP